jgi:hypothetical protein
MASSSRSSGKGNVELNSGTDASDDLTIEHDGVGQMLARQAAIVGTSEVQGTKGLLASIAKRKDHFPAMQTAYRELSGEGSVLQLHDGGRVIPGALAKGLLGFLRLDGTLELFQVTGFDEAVDLFSAVSTMDKKNKITFTRHEMCVFPIIHVSQLAWYQSDEAKVDLPLAGKLPRGAFYHSVCPLGVTIVDSDRSLGQVDCGMMSSSSSVGGMSPPAVHAVELPGAGRQHDPLKQRVSGLSPNVSLVFHGELHRYVNGVYGCVYDAVMGRGCYGGVRQSEELNVLLSSAVCVQLMSAQWVDLYWFASHSRDIHVMTRVGDGIVVKREDWVNWSVDQVEAAWTNAYTLFDRLFGLTSVGRGKFILMYTALQRLKLSQARFYPCLVLGWVQYEILNELASKFFSVITNANVTIAEVQQALDDFCIDENDVYFNKCYNAKEKVHQHQQLLGLKGRGRDGGVSEDPNPTLSKKQRKAKAKAAAATANTTTATTTTTGANGGGRGGGGGGGNKGSRPKSPSLCFSYLSTQGCALANCRFTHESAAGLEAAKVVEIKDRMAERTLVPDPTKF